MGEEDLFLFLCFGKTAKPKFEGAARSREPAAPSSSPIGPALENMGLTSYKDCVKWRVVCVSW